MCHVEDDLIYNFVVFLHRPKITEMLCQIYIPARNFMYCKVDMVSSSCICSKLFTVFTVFEDKVYVKSLIINQVLKKSAAKRL